MRDYFKAPKPKQPKPTKAELTYDLVEACEAMINGTSRDLTVTMANVIAAVDSWWTNPLDYPKNRSSNKGGKVKK